MREYITGEEERKHWVATRDVEEVAKKSEIEWKVSSSGVFCPMSSP